MKIDSAHHPIVYIHYDTPPVTPVEMSETLTHFSRLLARDQPFVFIADGSPAQGDPQDEVAARRQAALWMKANRQDLTRLIKGQVHIVTNADQAQTMQEFADVFIKFWGFPLFTAPSLEQAQARAAALLAEA